MVRYPDAGSFPHRHRLAGLHRADRVGVEAMASTRAGWLPAILRAGRHRQLRYLEDRGSGEKIAGGRKYRLHSNTERNLQWMAPLVTQ